ncbi:MAG: radical SAM protein [Deltaproteobacteria bacterium]|nr:radical SAM protein [Deltaproteobacteria bacterium]
MIGPAARVLRALAAVEPLYFSSFYRRARLYAERPTPTVATATLDLTTRCPLRCGFCFAAGTQETGREFSLDDVRAIEGQMRGLDKLVVLGGEPLAHPQIRAIVDEMGAAHDAVEFYTNGLPIPLDADRRDAWLRERFEGRRARFTLTLAVDEDHRAEIGPAEFARRVDAMVAAGRRFPWLGVRFNVTDLRLHTTGYLTPETVAAVLASLHEPLLGEFRSALAGGRLADRFQFNPVVRLGRAADGVGERWKAEDALFSPEVVLSPHDRGLSLLRALPAAWLGSPPAPLVRPLAGFSALADTLRTEWVGERLPAGRRAEAFAQFDRLAAAESPDIHAAARLGRQALEEWLAEWPAQRARWMEGVAARLDALLAEPGVAWDLSADRRVRRLTVPVLQRFAALRWARLPAQRAAWIERLALRATDVMARGQVPMFTGYAPRPGLLADAPDEPLPLDQTPIDAGPRPPHLGDALLRPRVVPQLWLDADGALDVALDGVGGVPFGPARSPDAVATAFAHALGMVAWLVPEQARGALVQACRSRIDALAGASDSARWTEALAQCAATEPQGVPDDAPEPLADARWLLAGEAADGASRGWEGAAAGAG